MDVAFGSSGEDIVLEWWRAFFLAFASSALGAGCCVESLSAGTGGGSSNALSSSREDVVLVWWMNTPPALCQAAFEDILAENTYGGRHRFIR